MSKQRGSFLILSRLSSRACDYPMSFLLGDTTASAAFHPDLLVNLLRRSWAQLHDVHPTVSHVALSVTLTFPGRTATTKFDFQIVDDGIEYDAVLGAQWIEWCKNDDRASLQCFYLVLCSDAPSSIPFFAYH